MCASLNIWTFLFQANLYRGLIIFLYLLVFVFFTILLCLARLDHYCYSSFYHVEFNQYSCNNANKTNYWNVRKKKSVISVKY